MEAVVSTQTAQEGPAGAPAHAEESVGAAPHAMQALRSIQVAFAGHNRSEDLGDLRLVAAGLRAACDLLVGAGLRDARLITGLAPGADCLAAQCWNEAALGPVHALFPFLDETPDACGEGLSQSTTWLDGGGTRHIGRNPYLAQTRWLIGAADLLIVVWTGEHARGAGGTADAVRLALEHGVPVLWVRPGDGAAIRLIRPEYLDEDFGFLEFLEQLRAGHEPLVTLASRQNVRGALRGPRFEDGPPDAEDEDVASFDRRVDHRSIAWLWRTYALFRRTLGGRAPAQDPHDPPEDLAAQPGFARLTAAHVAADARASRLGAIHRSQQVLLLGVAILTAVMASASAVWPVIKLGTVMAELTLALAALVVWMASERGRRHERWARARGLAEDLRIERVAWVLGVSTTHHGPNARGPRPALRIRRASGLPLGAYDPGRVRRWGAWAIHELIAGQAAYHRGQSTINGRIAHRVHQVENGSFAVLISVLVVYLLTSAAMALTRSEPPHWIADLVVVAGAIVPAIGAASLALEATLSLGEQSQRSRLLAAQLDSIQAHLGAEPGLEALQAAARSAIQLTRAQEAHWGEGTVRRRLFRGG